MVGWYILLGVLALLLAVWLLRVGVQIAFGQELRVTLVIGPKKIALLPKPEKKKKTKKKAPDKSARPAEKAEKKGKKKLPFTFDDVRSVVPVAFDALQKALGKIRRRMRVDPLTISISFGGEDPVKVAQMYGWADMAVWTMMPPLEQLLHIPNPHIHLETDYNSLRVRAEGRVGVKFRVGDLIVIGVTMALPLLRWYLDWRKKRPGQAGEKRKQRKTFEIGKDADHG